MRFPLAVLLLLPTQFLMAQTPSPECAARHYTLVALPLRPSHINDSGQVAGRTDSNQAVWWSERDGLKKITLPHEFKNAEATSINRAGHIVGVANTGDSGRRLAFLYSKGKTILLPGDPSKAYAINDDDEIAGEATIRGKSGSYPVLWKHQAVTSLGGCCGGFASAINQEAQAVGNVYDKDGRYQAFLWDNKHGLLPIGPSEGYSSAVAINDAGHVVVQVLTQVFIYKDGKLARLDLSSSPNQAYAMNNCDVIVGSFGPNSDEERAFLWEKTAGFVDLNTRIAPRSGWTLETATSINDRGEIVGWGDHKGADDAGFLLVPQQ